MKRPTTSQSMEKADHVSQNDHGKQVPLPEKWRRRLREQPSVSFTKHILPFLLVMILSFFAIRAMLEEKGEFPAHSKVKKDVSNMRTRSQEMDVPLVSKRFVMEIGGLTGDQTVARIILESKPEWAPLGVTRFHQLVNAGFYDQCRFFRVLPNFVAQFGINGNTEVQKEKRNLPIKDDPAVHSNERGTITYAMSGKDTRTTQLFINKKHNKYLDKEGFAPIAQIVEGMEHVDRINAEYKEKPNQGKIQNRGNAYLNDEFPHLSYIVTLQEVDSGNV